VKSITFLRKETALPPDGPTAFFSYSRDDSEFTLRLAEDLKAAGAACQGALWCVALFVAAGVSVSRASQRSTFCFFSAPGTAK